MQSAFHCMIWFWMRSWSGRRIASFMIGWWHMDWAAGWITGRGNKECAPLLSPPPFHTWDLWMTWPSNLREIVFQHQKRWCCCAVESLLVMASLDPPWFCILYISMISMIYKWCPGAGWVLGRREQGGREICATAIHSVYWSEWGINICLHDILDRMLCWLHLQECLAGCSTGMDPGWRSNLGVEPIQDTPPRCTNAPALYSIKQWPLSFLPNIWSGLSLPLVPWACKWC